ncbi:unnamed protein product [Moneuplotes crassus]|uniref:Palmitoyltransferase n=1 Tax=Euplotes crassus TaxID=5936 RepID=A0AAD1X6M1_EUPCR|nr:unnamed protein product [Moneuplotes crassus]
MDSLSNRNIDDSFGDHRESYSQQDYYSVNQDDSSSGLGSLRNRRSRPRNSTVRNFKGKLTEGDSIIDEEENVHLNVEEESNGTDLFQIDQLLQDFNADEFLNPPPLRDRIVFYLLRFKAGLPMFTTLLLIYGIGLSYFLTYLLPIVYSENRDNSEESESVKRSEVYTFIILVILFISFMFLISFSLYKASYTDPGSTNNPQEWDIKDTETIFASSQPVEEVFARSHGNNNQKELSFSNNDPNSYLNNVGKLRYFELQGRQAKRVILKNISNFKPLNESEMNYPVSQQIFCGVESDVTQAIRRRYRKKMQEFNLDETSPAINDDSNRAYEGQFRTGQDLRKPKLLQTPKTFEDERISHLDVDRHFNLKRNLDTNFPIFTKTFENKKDGSERICIKCLKKKPDRCHHCSVCNVCTLMMDHHCPWVNNCIGFYNYKYFFLLINYCMISAWFINITYWEEFVRVLASVTTSNIYLLVVCTTFMFSVVMSIILTCFCIFHFRLIMTNYTTLEYCEKKREKESTWQVSPYDLKTATQNIKSKLGYDPLFKLLFPLKPNLQSTGTSFPVTERFIDEFEMSRDMAHEDESEILRDF